MKCLMSHEARGSAKDKVLLKLARVQVFGKSAMEEELTEVDEPPLIPGLPNDVAMLCLAYVSRLQFPALRAVSRRWRRLLQSKEFYQTRNEAGTLEERLYILTASQDHQTTEWQVFSPLQNGWGRIPPMPGPTKTNFGYVVTCQRLLVMGGLAFTGSESAAAADVYTYDCTLNRWSKLASMITPRYDFACGVLGGLVYVVGGHGPQDDECLSSVEVYDPQRDEWKEVAKLKRARWGCSACPLEGKLYVFGGRSKLTIGSSRHMDVYDPATKKWQEVKNGCVMVLAHAVLHGRLFCIEWKDERQLRVFSGADRLWSKVSLPILSSRSMRFCLGCLNGKLLLLSTRYEPGYETLVYDPSGKTGKQWQTSAIKPQGPCLCCASIAA